MSSVSCVCQCLVLRVCQFYVRVWPVASVRVCQCLVSSVRVLVFSVGKCARV